MTPPRSPLDAVRLDALRLVLAVAMAALAAWALPSHAADTSKTVILVAKPQLHDPFYRATILVVRPLGGDQHVGLIVNRPTKMTLGQLFPDHKPSQTVREPVYLGGPSSSSVIFALVRTEENPGGRALQLLPDLFIVFEGKAVDHIIEHEARRARFIAGLVAWRPGELQREIKRGAWYVLDADPALVMRKSTDGLWEELVRRAEMRANGI